MNPVFARGNQRTAQRLIALRRQAIQDNAARVAQRLHAIVLSLEGRTAPEIAGLLKVHRSTVPLWIQQWNHQREDGLLEGHRSGRPSQLTARQRQQLQDILDSGPVAYGLDTGVWTSPIIGEVIAQEWDVRFHPGHVRKLLRQLGYSVQRPTTRLVQADPVKKHRWVRYRYPPLKKRPGPKKR
ncbi:MAG: IS630 family transposase [Verrucomicrobia bacterium]|nr:IS630 family transposase [Verrucomicrobiota bacterium]